MHTIHNTPCIELGNMRNERHGILLNNFQSSYLGFTLSL